MPAFSNYDMWKLRSPDDERPCGDDPEPEIEEMDEDDWLEKQEIEMTEKQPQVSDDGTAETAAEIAHFEPVESYIRDLFSEPSSLTDDEKTLIAGNLRAFYATIHPFELDEMDRQMIDEAWRKHSAAGLSVHLIRRGEMKPKLTEIDKEVLKRALADPKSEERKQVGAAMIAMHKAAIVDMLRDCAPPPPRSEGGE